MKRLRWFVLPFVAFALNVYSAPERHARKIIHRAVHEQMHVTDHGEYFRMKVVAAVGV